MDKGDLFSIRKWVSEEILDLYHWARGEMREGLKPALSLWIDTAIKAVLHLEPIHQERLWFCIDELATLQKLDILKRALSKTRKYGLCLVLGVQDFSQLYGIYGRDLAKTIISGCQRKLLLRVRRIGQAAGRAAGSGRSEREGRKLELWPQCPDGVSIFARRAMRDLVLTSSILTQEKA
ncbi:type VI secretion protein [Cucumis melo var. makuwa]|uniref:Type VI secretion protein n=1 Tax=Cucumis melo var. makuwa TaxID=1194695 RepID=A0A5A7UDC6_CUCMM|nr:type VI secretion protein [Cucumis melo var. makuwa]TYK19878.1 type VI secretion protein [Cucumis melo var. makuwa]